jgi:hypothetical protein
MADVDPAPFGALPRALLTGPGHARLPAVRAALDMLVLPTGRPEVTTASMRKGLDAAWAARHGSGAHREVLGGLLPGLVVDARRAVHAAESPGQREARLAMLAETYALTQFFAAYQPEAALVWRLVDRGMVTAAESGDLRAIGVAAWMGVQAHRESTGLDAAEDLSGQALSLLGEHLEDAPVPVRAVYGALQADAGVTAARRGRHGDAWRAIDTAERVALTLPHRWTDPVTSFGRTTVGLWSTSVAVELRDGTEGVRQAGAVTLASRPRRARHLIEAARAHDLTRQPEQALTLVGLAADAAVETVLYNGHARSVILKHSVGRSAARRRQAADVALRAGLLAT